MSLDSKTPMILRSDEDPPIPLPPGEEPPPPVQEPPDKPVITTTCVTTATLPVAIGVAAGPSDYEVRR